ncbi:MAG: phosphopyruvate hydratase [Candidatus Methanofastidiosa archaeon]|nr:phosphopyruvate hydratase [Candidatus Methanofastidiosa archaeon]
MYKIERIHAREILDSRGNPTVETEVTIQGLTEMAAVPSGASTGAFEALELRDKDESRYLGKGVLKAVGYVNNELWNGLKDFEFNSQQELDNKLIELDGTENKDRYGANSLLSISMAVARVLAKLQSKELYEYLGDGNVLPVPMMNILNGGEHASNNVDIQEFMIMPVGAPSFKEGLRWCAEVYHNLAKILKERNLSAGIGDEGGFAPNLENDEDALKLIMEAINKSGYEPGKDFMLTIDSAVTEWQVDGGYRLPKAGIFKTTDEMIDYWEDLVNRYPISSLEDGLGEEDWDGWVKLTQRLGNRIQLVGDDLFVTNPKRLAKGIEMGAGNSILIKLNQIGTVTETIDAIKLAYSAGYRAVVSHRSGETEDTFISDLAVGLGTKQLKTGAPARSERVAKYNRLLRIEEKI